MFRLRFLGHAGWLVENDNFKALCDPWFGPQGGYLGQWYPFPKNSHILTSDLLKDLDFIYISHVHEDHYDKWLLKQVDKRVPIYIADFRDTTLIDGLQNLGFKNIVKFSSDTESTLKNINIRIIKEETHLDADSCILFDDGTHTILNMNDCHIDFSKLKIEEET